MKSVDAFIDALPDDKIRLVERLREMILSQVPGIEEKLSFKIPFYHYYGMFCYINPTAAGVDLGFCRGKDLLDEFPVLQLKSRAIIATLPLSNEKDIEDFKVREIVLTAAAWNKEARQLKIPMVSKRKKKQVAAKKKKNS